MSVEPGWDDEIGRIRYNFGRRTYSEERYANRDIGILIAVIDLLEKRLAEERFQIKRLEHRLEWAEPFVEVADPREPLIERKCLDD